LKQSNLATFGLPLIKSKSCCHLFVHVTYTFFLLEVVQSSFMLNFS